MMSIIGAVLPLAVEVFLYFIRKSNLSDEAKKTFFEFAKKAGSDMGSVRLMEAGDKQLKWLAENPWKEGVH